MEKFVIYRRVSGGHNQIKSGYGLDVQSTEIQSYLSESCTDYKIIEDFTELHLAKTIRTDQFFKKQLKQQ